MTDVVDPTTGLTADQLGDLRRLLVRLGALTHFAVGLVDIYALDGGPLGQAVPPVTASEPWTFVPAQGEGETDGEQ